MMVRIEPMADASLPDMRARIRPGTAMAAMIPMMATTISSSISVKPSFLCIFFTGLLLWSARVSARQSVSNLRAPDSVALVVPSERATAMPGKRDPFEACHNEFYGNKLDAARHRPAGVIRADKPGQLTVSVNADCQEMAEDALAVSHRPLSSSPPRSPYFLA